MNSVRMGLNALVSLAGKPGKASPTNDLKSELLNLIYSDTYRIRGIDKIVIADAFGNEKDTIDVSLGDCLVNPAESRLYISKKFKPSSSYLLGKIRLKAGDKTYFEGSVSGFLSAGSETPVSATITLTNTWVFNKTPLGSSVNVDDSTWREQILDAIAGYEVSANIGLIHYGTAGSYTLSYDTSARRIYASGNFTSSGSFNIIRLCTRGGIVQVNIQLDRTIDVTTSDTYSFQLFIVI